MINQSAPPPAAASAGLCLSVSIRPMVIKDLPQVHAIDLLSFSLPWPESSFRYEMLENPRSLLRVAEVESPQGHSLLVGAVVVWLVLDEAHIATLAVHPDYRRRGIARCMMSEILGEVASQGAQEVTLEVRESNIAAQSLYHSFGFAVVGRRLRYYHDNHEDALIMTLDRLDDAYLKRLEHWGGQEGTL